MIVVEEVDVEEVVNPLAETRVEAVAALSVVKRGTSLENALMPVNTVDKVPDLILFLIVSFY